jgi:prepilin-type N-terminal cleavage/methylation domain-containing protein
MARTQTGRGFTLIELVVVMMLLTTALAVCAPRLSNFVRGRKLTEESRRFLALTRYARSEAASRGVPMDLWLDPQAGKYGLEPAQGFATDKEQPLEFVLADGLKFDVGSASQSEQGRETIAFGPDGDIEANSLDDVKIREDDTHAIEIGRASLGMSFEIKGQ